MYSNNIVNFQESTTILNACTKKVWKHIVCTSYIKISRLNFLRWSLIVFIIKGFRFKCFYEECRRIYRPKRCGNNNKDENNSPKTLNDKNIRISFYDYFTPLGVFHTSISWWSLTGIWVTASLLKSPRLFSVFWPILIELSFGWSPLVFSLPIFPVPLPILRWLHRVHRT